MVVRGALAHAAALTIPLGYAKEIMTTKLDYVQFSLYIYSYVQGCNTFGVFVLCRSVKYPSLKNKDYLAFVATLNINIHIGSYNINPSQ